MCSKSPLIVTSYYIWYHADIIMNDAVFILLCTLCLPSLLLRFSDYGMLFLHQQYCPTTTSPALTISPITEFPMTVLASRRCCVLPSLHKRSWRERPQSCSIGASATARQRSTFGRPGTPTRSSSWPGQAQGCFAILATRLLRNFIASGVPGRSGMFSLLW